MIFKDDFINTVHPAFICQAWSLVICGGIVFNILPVRIKTFIPVYAILMAIVNAFLIYEARRQFSAEEKVSLMIAGAVGSPLGAMALEAFHPEWGKDRFRCNHPAYFVVLYLLTVEIVHE